MTFDEACKLPKDHPARHTILYGSTFKGTMTGSSPSLQNIPKDLTACTRIESLKKIRPASRLQQRILDTLQGMPAMSRADIGTYTGISTSSLCGRIDELVQADKIEVAGTKQDPVTKRKVVTYKLKGGV